MIQISSLMWAVAIFFALIGFMRGWNKEVIATAGVGVTAFALFQFDSILRASVFIWLPRDQVFWVQAGLFLAAVFIAYRTRAFVGTRRSTRDLQTSALGGMVGFLNGYLIAGTLWYFLDINEYPLAPLVIAPAPGSPSDQARDLIPLVILGGGTNGTGDFLAIAVVVLILIVMVIL
jgi:uncharacterized membrane protein (GlpM family)